MWTNADLREEHRRRTARAIFWLAILAWTGVARIAEGAAVAWSGGSLPLATDGAVNGFACIGSTLYLAGSFTSVGPNTGGGVPVDPSSGKPVPCFARVNGTVYASVSDGLGGWFIGGDFTAAGGVPRVNLAHVRADGGVACLRADTDGAVRALAIDGETLFVGGDFTHVAGEERDHLAAVSVRTSELTAWNPRVSGIAWYFTTVYCVLPTAGAVYVGGDFTSVQGENRSCLAALDRFTPSVHAFDPAPDGPVHAMVGSDSSLYLGGAFYHIDQQPSRGLAQVSASSGALRPWSGTIASTEYAHDVPYYVSSLAIGDTSLYVAGHFTRVDGEVRGGVAALDLATGQVQAWNPNAIDELRLTQAPFVHSIAVSGDVAFVAGQFRVLGSVPRMFVAGISRSTGTVGGFDPRANGEAFTIGVGEGSVFVGGRMSSLWDWQSRDQLAAIDLDTGTLKPWRADPDWQVMCIAADGHSVYVGGRFASINGVARQNIAALDPETGAPTRWNPGAANGSFTAVYSLATGGGRVYACGDFTTVGGLPRSYVAAIESTGTVSPWSPNPDFWVTAICPAGPTVYVAGYFAQIGGQPRSGLAELDAVTGLPTGWNPGTDGTVLALAASGDVVYVGGQFRNLGGASRASLGAVGRMSGTATAWDPGAGGSPYSSAPIIRALLPSNGALYIAGDFAQIGGATRYFAAALDTGSARALDWNPDISLDLAESAGPLWCLLERDDMIFFGGLVTRYGAVPAGGYGEWPAIDAAPVTSEQPVVRGFFPNPATTGAMLSFALPTAAQVSLTVFDLQGRRVGRPIARELRLAGDQCASINVAGWLPGCYLCRLDVGGRVFTRKLIVLRK